MQLNLSELFTCKGKVKKYTVEIEMDRFDFHNDSYTIVSKKPLEVTVQSMENRTLLLQGCIDLTMEIPCNRCLDPVLVPFHIMFDKSVDMKLTEDERVDELDEQPYINGYNLDVDSLVHNELILNLPMKVLCNKGCKGICNRCGANLNIETCDCDSGVLDPRMSVIQDIFNNFKEV